MCVVSHSCRCSVVSVSVCLSVVTHNRELYKTARKGIWIGSADVVWVVVDSGGPKNPGPRSSLPRAGCTAGHLPVIIVKYMEYPAPEEVIGSLENLTTTLYNTLLRDSGMPASQNAESHVQQQQQQQPFNGRLSGTTRVGRYQKKHSPTHTHPDHRASFITFLHLQRSMASSLFSLRA